MHVLSPARSTSGNRFRKERWRQFLTAFPDVAEMKVVDLGGTPESWLESPIRPARVVSINLEESGAELPGPWYEARAGDACDPSCLGGETFDVVYSNSVIEHVGGHEQRKRFADVVHRAADRHWIQTPNRWFPIEPHWMCPGFQFLPLPARVLLSRYWPLGSFRAGSSCPAPVVVDDVLQIELLSASQLGFYFPTSTILRERVVGLPKSLIAVEGAVDQERQALVPR